MSLNDSCPWWHFHVSLLSFFPYRCDGPQVAVAQKETMPTEVRMRNAQAKLLGNDGWRLTNVKQKKGQCVPRNDCDEWWPEKSPNFMSILGNAFFILSLAVGTANCWVALLQDQSVPSSSQVPIASNIKGRLLNYTKLLFLRHAQSLNDMSHSVQFSFFWCQCAYRIIRLRTWNHRSFPFTAWTCRRGCHSHDEDS